jgi:phosphatidylserine/phosphatidylglycerophosphate/cardiolipin synthase-like enzyme
MSLKRETKQRTRVLFAVLGIVMLIGVVIALVTIGHEGTAPSVIVENGSVRVVFCPECEAEFLALLRGGGDIECALYNYGPAVEDALRASNARVLTDAKDGGEYGTPIAVSGLMHHKFCIVNKTIVTSGSYNPTQSGSLSANNLLIITSPSLAQSFHAEFAAVTSGAKNAKTLSSSTIVLVDSPTTNTTIRHYFCPRDGCEERVQAALLAATQEIVFAQYAFTSDAVRNALLAQRSKGVFVQGACDRSLWNVRGGECATLDARRWSGERLLHHKVFVIDNETVVTGSYNPTAAGNTRNSENVMLITDARVAAQYRAEYERVYSLSTPLE